MVTTDTLEKRQRLQVRVARHITCNPPETVRSLDILIAKVIDNILAAPDDPKYRDLRATNTTISSKILAPHGGKELLHLLGFEKIEKYGDTFYYMSEVDPVYLTTMKNWLHDQVEAALSLNPTFVSGTLTCAECVIQMRLTSGQILEGGFGAKESICSVYNFLKSSVVNSEEPLLLRIPGSISLTSERMNLTLEEAGLVPRSVLQVIKSGAVDGASEKVMIEARLKARKEEADAAEHLRKIKESRLKEVEAQKVEKERILDQFKHDHTKFKAHTAFSRRLSDSGYEETKSHN